MLKQILDTLGSFLSKDEASETKLILTDERKQLVHLNDIKALVSDPNYQKIFGRLGTDMTTAEGLQTQFDCITEFPATVAFVRRGDVVDGKRTIEITGVWVDQSGNLVDRPPNRTIIG